MFDEEIVEAGGPTTVRSWRRLGDQRWHDRGGGWEAGSRLMEEEMIIFSSRWREFLRGGKSVIARTIAPLFTCVGRRPAGNSLKCCNRLSHTSGCR
jgi:hypothetical protein